MDRSKRLLAVLISCLVASVVVLPAKPARAVDSGEAQWIWSPDHAPFNAPQGTCYFRRSFRMGAPESGRIEITCDNAYELFVNGRPVGAGKDWKTFDDYDIGRLLVVGDNTIAVRCMNDEPGSAGLIARVTVKQKGNTDQSYSTDGSWRVTTEEQRNWQASRFNDSRWAAAQVLGELREASAWKDHFAGDQRQGGARFTAAPNFRVERVTTPEAVGSVVAMAFNERGEIIASRAGGPLVRVRDDNGDGAPEAVSVYCDKVTNCQGILPLNGHVFAVGEGPEGTGFYRVSDSDSDGVGETITTLFKFKGRMGEHGPHAPLLGPDGMIYLMIGNHSSVDLPVEPTSPYHHYYEGDLLTPKYEDAGGHAVGIKAPCGVVVRTNLQGEFVELVAGGMRNAYDMAFNKQGDLFTWDSDMEWDEGLPWYRPTRVLQLVPGGEYGSRSGWSVWPDYFIDGLPPLSNTGRGSPAGVECYNHHMYPTRYHNALFLCDWSLGRIVVARMEPSNGTYAARNELFLQGRPLNVTDIAVGPDGWLYFATGGRDTEGGIYRIVYGGRVPPRPKEAGVIQAIRQPQLYSAWGRNRVANIKREIGDSWAADLTALIQSPRYSADDRTRGLDLMQLVGPSPSTTLLVKLSRDGEKAVRAKAVDLMGVHVDDATNARLIELLDDEDPTVRRKACESLVRAEAPLPVAKLVALLTDASRFVARAAMRALQQAPIDNWRSTVLSSPHSRQFLLGSVALLQLEPKHETGLAVIEHASELMQGFLSDDDFLGLLRVMELALIRGEIKPDEVAPLRGQLAEEYPALEPRMNRELARLLIYLQDATVLPRYLEELARDDNPVPEKIHLGLSLRYLNSGWTTEDRLAVLRFYEQARVLPGGHSYAGYIDNVSRDFVASMTPDEQWLVVTQGDTLPSAALRALPSLVGELPEDRVTALIELDRRLQSNPTDATRDLGVGLIAILGQSRRPEAMAYLRDVFEQLPERRQDAAMGLAQEPNGENWDFLVRALPVCEGPAAQEVLMQLAQVDHKPDQPEPLRQVILTGLKLGDGGGKYAVSLLEKWTGQRPEYSEDKTNVALAAWQEWFTQKYPDQPPPQLPTAGEENKHSFEELLAFLNSDEAAHGDATRGAAVFDKAQCIKCHRFGARGEGVGPDLSGVSRRFQKKEVLESVIHPSQVISDQYSSKTVVTTGGLTYTGIVAPSGENAIVVLQASAEKVVIAKDEIEEIVPSNKSAMPEGLFNTLTLEEIADLFAYLGRPPQ
ncbi:MAG: HEAT repeat domain-containing protein [Pirellulales bacterium]|nr:HEAT repeat domain-containing protein [Pirellulales bacterium]